MWVVREASKNSVKVCGGEAKDRDLEQAEEQGWEEENCLLLTLWEFEGRGKLHLHVCTQGVDLGWRYHIPILGDG